MAFDDNPRAAEKLKFWILLLLFAAIYLAIRLPWISCDPGIPSVWEYGYNVTDEGYYLSGGKEKFLWGFFVDLPRNEAFTYGFSAGTHWLSYVSHLAFGLSTWTWRLPFLAICLCAWLFSFGHVARRAGSAAAFVLCTATSLVPMVVAYERTASNDALIGALLVLAYVCAAGRSAWRSAAAGLLCGSIILVKPSAWVLMPVAAAGVAEERELRACVRRLLVFAGTAVASAFAWKLVVALSVAPDAARAGVSMWEIVKRTTTHYPLPSIFDVAPIFKGLSSFPRDPSIQLLGAAAALILPVPVAMAARNALAGRWNGHFLLFISIPAYVAAVSVMNTIYTHYFLPAISFVPIMACAAARETGGEGAAPWKKAAAPLALVAALCAAGAIGIASYAVPPAVSQDFYSRVYNLPRNNVWGMTWPFMLVFAAGAVAVLSAMRGFRVSKVQLAAWAVVSLVFASAIFAAMPAVQLAPYFKKTAAEYFAPMVVMLVASSLLLAAIFGFKGNPPRGAAVLAVPLCLLSTYLATPNWRSAFLELVRPGTNLHERAAKELAALLPADAIVVGERSNQMLMSLPIRTAATFAANSDPIPVIESVLKAEPDAKLYALADSQHAYNLQHYKEHAGKYRLRLVKTFRMPSFGTGAMADVHLCEIQVLGRPPAGKKAPEAPST